MCKKVVGGGGGRKSMWVWCKCPSCEKKFFLKLKLKLEFLKTEKRKNKKLDYGERKSGEDGKNVMYCAMFFVVKISYNRF